MIQLIAGLGNPGAEYEGTRHNAGFQWINAAAQQLGVRLVAERSYFGLAARVNRPAGPLWLLQPMTFMNLSGKSVAALARFFKIAPEEVLVVRPTTAGSSPYPASSTTASSAGSRRV